MAEKGSGKAKNDAEEGKSKVKGSGGKFPAKKNGPKKITPKGDEPKTFTAADMPAEVVKAMQSVIDYSWADEMASAEESYRENGSIEGHVFADLVTIKSFLDGTKIDPLDLLDDEE